MPKVFDNLFARLAGNSQQSMPVKFPVQAPDIDNWNGNQAILPSWMRTGFEGAVDTGLGMLGVGPDTRANRFGNFVTGMMPALSNTVRTSTLPTLRAPLTSAGEEINSLKAPVKLPKAPMNPGNPLFDNAGRFIGFEPAPDQSFRAHVLSSVGKTSQPKFTPNVPVVNPGRYSRLAPSNDMLEQLMAQYKK